MQEILCKDCAGSNEQQPSVSLEILNVAFVLLGRCFCIKGAEVAALTSLGILLARIEAILSRLQFSNHDAKKLAIPLPLIHLKLLTQRSEQLYEFGQLIIRIEAAGI